MASAYGIIHNYGEPQSMFGAWLALQALQYKQQKYDANTIKIEQTLNQYGMRMNDLVRPKDREYLYNRLNNLVNNIHGLQDNTDIGNNSVTQGIIGHINQALDPYVVEQLGISKNIQNFQQQVQAAQESKEGAYSDINYQYGVHKAGLNSYLNNETDSLTNPLRYTPYVDYKKKLNSIIENRKKIMGEESVDVRDGKGGIVTKTYNNLTDADWMQVLQSEITPDMKRQMQIDGWAMMGGVSDEVAVEQQEASYLANKDAIQTKIDEKKILLDKADKYNKNILKNDISTLEKQIAVLDDEYTNAPKTAEGIGGTYIMNSTIANFAAIAGSGPSVELSKDDLYFARLKANESKVLTGGGTTVEGIRVSDTTTQDLVDIDQEDFLTNLNTTEATYNREINSAWNTVPQNKRLTLQSEIDKYTAEGLTEEDAKFKAYESYAKRGKDKQALINLENIKAAKRQYNQAVEITSNGYEKYMGEELWQTNADKLYSSIKEQGYWDRIKVSNLNGETLNSGDYIETVKYTVDGVERTGVKNAEEFKEFLKTEEGKNLKLQVSSDVFWGAANTEGRFTPGGAITFERFNEEDFRDFKTVASIAGEGDLKLTDVFNIKTSSGDEVSEEYILSHINDTEGERYIFEVKEESNTKTAEHLRKRAQIRENSSYNVDRLSVVDKTFYNDSTIRNIFTGSNVAKATTEAIRREEIAINTPKKLTIDAPATAGKETETWRELKAVINSGDVVSGAGFKLDYGTPANIMINPNNPNQIIISQSKTKDVFDIRTVSYTPIASRASVIVTKNNFTQLAPTIAQQIDLQTSESNVDYLRTLEEDYNNLSYVEGKDAAQINNYTDVLGMTANLAMESKMYDVVENRLGDEYAAYKPHLNTMIERSNSFKLNLNKEGNQVIVNLSANTADGEELLYSFDNLSSKETLKILDIAPQIFLSMYIMYVADHINANGGRPTRLITDLTTTLNNLK